MRTASCRCGQLRLSCEGEPVRVSVCHCLACQRRTGSAFSAQARWPDARVAHQGVHREWTRRGDEGGRVTYRFCPDCGTTISYRIDLVPGVTAIPLGGFDDPHGVPPPQVSVHERRRHSWVVLADDALDHRDD